jgi:hypothetical protein
MESRTLERDIAKPQRWRHRNLLRVVLVLVGLVVVALYIHVMLDFHSQPVIPYRVSPTVPPTQTVLQRSAPNGTLDFPSDGATIVGATQVRGWALDAAAEDGSGVDSVQLLVDGQVVGDANYGQPRPDVGDVFGPRFEPSGWVAQLDVSQLPVGAHRLEARAHSTFSDVVSTYAASIVVEARASSPTGAIDLPQDGSDVSGSVDVAGWAVDEAANKDSGVDSVRLYVDGSFAAEASIGKARPDIGTAYGRQFVNAGWSATVDLQSVDPGEHQLEARVHSSISDQVTSYTSSINVAAP